MVEALEKIIKEKISADHLLYVSMKYTKTCDVMINLIKRWKIMLDYAFDGLFEIAKKKKIIKNIPTAPKLRVDVLREIFSKDEDVMKILEIYQMFKLIEVLKNSKENEFRKGVCLRIIYKGEEVAVDLEKLKEYSEDIQNFINFTKDFIVGK